MKDTLIKIYRFISDRFYFKILYLFISLSFVSLLNALPIIKPLNKLTLLWGVVLIICHFIDLATRRRKFYFLDISIYCFLLVTLILTLIKYPTGENFKVWLINCILLFSVFSIEDYKNKDRLVKELNIISLLYTIFTFFASILSLILIMSPVLMDKIKLVISSINFTNYAGFYSSTNTLGITAAISLAISIYLIASLDSHKKLKIILYINSILQIVTFIISKCRSSIFIVLALVFAFIFIKYKNKFARISLITLPSIVLLYVGTHLHSFMSLLTGRYDLWYTAYNLLHYWPTTGVGYSNMVPMMKYYKVATELAYLPGIDLGGVHNIYLQTAVINGLLSLFIFLIILISLIIYIVKGIDNSLNHNRNKFTIILGLLLGILLINLMESSLIYIVSFISMIFWIYSSYIIAIIKENKTC